MPPRFFYASAQGVECRGIYVVLAEGSIWRRIQGFTARCRRGGTTTRHAASLRSSNNCKCLIEAFMISRGEGP